MVSELGSSVRHSPHVAAHNVGFHVCLFSPHPLLLDCPIPVLLATYEVHRASLPLVCQILCRRKESHFPWQSHSALLTDDSTSLASVSSFVDKMPPWSLCFSCLKNKTNKTSFL